MRHSRPRSMQSLNTMSHTAAAENHKLRLRRDPRWKSAIILAASVLAAILTGLHLPPEMAVAAGLGVFCIGMWATAAVPEYLPALVFFVVAIILQVAPPQVVLGAFQSSTLWLLFGGMVMGSSIRFTGLGQRMASLLAGMLGRRYGSVIAGVVAFSLALAFFLPSSMGRIVLLVPIILSLADHMCYGEGSAGRTGMLMAAAFGTCIPAYAILPANTPNMILAGTAESLYGVRIGYFDYLVLHFPVLGAGKAAALVGLILWMFPDRAPLRTASDVGAAQPLSRRERHLAVLLVVSLLLWLTDALHHVSPGWIALAAAIWCLWPGSGLTSPKCLNEEINYATLFFVAGIMGLGAVIASTGLGETIVAALGEHAGFAPDQPFHNVAALLAISSLVAAVTNLPGVPAVLTPGAGHLAAVTGLPLAIILMTQVLAFSSVLLPYQAPPLVTATQIANLAPRAVTRLCLALFAVTVLVLLPLDLAWWHVLEMFRQG